LLLPSGHGEQTRSQGSKQYQKASHCQLSVCSVLNSHTDFKTDVTRCVRREFLAIPSTAPAKKFRERRLIACTPEQLYNVVADVDQYKNFVPWCRNSEIVKVVDDNHFQADLEVGFQLFSEKYTSNVTLGERKITSEAIDGTVFHRLLFSWEFNQGPTANTTWATFCVEYSFKNKIYMQTSVMFFDQVVSKMVGAFAMRTNQVYGKL
jgi:coenzyme Q-binding protein COQ10